VPYVWQNLNAIQMYSTLQTTVWVIVPVNGISDTCLLIRIALIMLLPII